MPPLNVQTLGHFFLPHDIGRLDSYTRNMLDFHVIIDLLPACAQTFFLFNSGIEISPAQRVILVGLGLQHRSVESVGEDLRLPPTQVLALFMKCMKKFANRFNALRIATAEVVTDLNNAEQKAKRIRVERVQDDSKQVEASGRAAIEALEKKQAELLATLPMEQFALGTQDLASRPPAPISKKAKKQHSSKSKDKKRKHH